MVRISILSIFLFVLSQRQLIAQTPIMIVTCKGRNAFLVGNKETKSKNNAQDYDLADKKAKNKSLKNAAVMEPDCSLATCLTCNGFSGPLYWEPLTQSCECFVDIGDAPPEPVIFSGNSDCNCPEGTIVTVVDVNGDGILESTCAYPPCYTGSYDTTIECGQEDLTIDIELCAFTGADAYGSVLVVESLIGCEFVSEESFDLLSQGDNTVGLGPADADGCIRFQVVLDQSDVPATISFEGDEIISLEIPVCPTANDPCICDNLFSNEPPLFSDVLNVMGLPINAIISLDPTYALSGFKDASNNLLLPGTILGSSDAIGNFNYSFYRGPGEMADIELTWTTISPDRNGKISFVSPDSCPDFNDCTPLPPERPIPTLNQWGIISLSLLLMILGVARIKSMEQGTIESSLK